jgi:hypothetical protein
VAVLIAGGVLGAMFLGGEGSVEGDNPIATNAGDSTPTLEPEPTEEPSPEPMNRGKLRILR